MQSRSRDSSVSSRHTSGSAPPARHRPPALNGLSSNRSSYVSRTGGTIFSPDQSSPSSSKLKPLRLVSVYVVRALADSHTIILVYDYKFIKLWIFFVIIWHYPIIDYCCIIRFVSKTFYRWIRIDILSSSNFTSSIISICIIGLFYVT